MKRNLTREIVEEKLAAVSDSRTDEVLVLAFDHQPYAHQYMELTVSAVRRLCGWNAPIALALPQTKTSIDCVQGGIRRALRDLGIAELFQVYRKGNRVFIAPRSALK